MARGLWSSIPQSEYLQWLYRPHNPPMNGLMTIPDHIGKPQPCFHPGVSFPAIFLKKSMTTQLAIQKSSINFLWVSFSSRCFLVGCARRSGEQKVFSQSVQGHQSAMWGVYQQLSDNRMFNNATISHCYLANRYLKLVIYPSINLGQSPWTPGTLW